MPRDASRTQEVKYILEDSAAKALAHDHRSEPVICSPESFRTGFATTLRGGNQDAWTACMLAAQQFRDNNRSAGRERWNGQAVPGYVSMKFLQPFSYAIVVASIVVPAHARGALVRSRNENNTYFYMNNNNNNKHTLT
jgi:hypothetical protein